MAAKKLTDPILNDLQQFVLGKHTPGTLSHQAVTRYRTHLERLDDELVAARKGTGNIALGINEEVVKISNQALEGMTTELDRLRTALVNTTEQAQLLDKHGRLVDVLAQALFDEFGDVLALVDGPDAVQLALNLLRLWRPAEKTGEPLTEAASDRPDPSDPVPAPGDAVRSADRPASAGPGRSRARAADAR